MTEPEQARRSPLHDAHVAAGASFTDFAGWQMPVRYSGELAEHRAVREAAGLFDLSHMAEILVIGPDAAAALDAALAGELSASAEYQAKYSLLLDANGGVLDDVVVYRTGADRFMVVANAANRETVARELRARAEGFDARVFDESDEVALIAVQGPLSRAVLAATDGLSADGTALPLAQALTELRYYRSIPAKFADRPILIARTGYTGEDGFELYVDPGDATALWDALLAAGSPLGLIPAGLASRDTLRLEAGMPLYGHELTRNTLPVQAGLGRVPNLRKSADFVGRSAVEAGPAADAPVLVGLAGTGRRAARAGYTVYAGDEPVGTVTSGALSPTLGHPIAMAYVAPHAAESEGGLAVDVRGSRLAFAVTPLPFYRRKKN